MNPALWLLLGATWTAPLLAAPTVRGLRSVVAQLHEPHVALHQWGDPFVFQAEGRRYLIARARLGLEPTAHPSSALPLYTATGGEDWRFLGLAFEPPEASCQAPKLFQVDATWILLYSSPTGVHYHCGRLDLVENRFQSHRTGSISFGTAVHAANVTRTSDGRHLLWGTIPHHSALHSPGLTRLLTLSPGGFLRQAPAPERTRLRRAHFADVGVSLQNSTYPLPGVVGRRLELEATFDPGSASRFGFEVLRTEDGRRGVQVELDRKGVSIREADNELVRAPFRRGAGTRTLSLHIFLHEDVVEVRAPDGNWLCATVNSRTDGNGVALYAQGGWSRLQRVDAWSLAAPSSETSPPEAP